MVKITIPDHRTVGWNYLYSVAHWRKRKQIADEIHELVWAYCKKLKIPKFKERIDVSFTAHAKRPLDPDNLCCKLYLDGLVKAKVIDDDNRLFVGKITLESKKDCLEFLEIVITPSSEQNPS